jgi:hypothetical protein
MTTATTTIRLWEIAAGQPERVDTEAGVIYGVKVLGLESQNTGRTLGLDAAEFGQAVDRPYAYALEALQQAAPDYEGVPVFVDHPEFLFSPDGSRSPAPGDRKTADRFGRLVRVRVTESGLYADLEYLRAHPLAPLVVEVAQRMPDVLAISHNAAGEPALRGDRIVIERISDVRSVDIVGERPGTTKGLFETEQKTVDPMQAPPLPAEPPAETNQTPPAESVKWGFRDAVMAVLDGKGENTEKVGKIKGLLAAEEKAMSALVEDDAEEEEAEEEGTEEEGKEKSMAECNDDRRRKTNESAKVTELQERLRRLETEREARDLLESAAVPCDEIKLAALAALPDKQARQKLVESWIDPWAGRPRSTAARNRQEDNQYADASSFAARIQRR